MTIVDFWDRDKRQLLPNWHSVASFHAQRGGVCIHVPIPNYTTICVEAESQRNAIIEMERLLPLTLNALYYILPPKGT